MIRKVSAEDIAIRGNGTGLEYMCPTRHFAYIFFNPVFQVSTAKNEINLFNYHILIEALVTFAPAGAMTPSAEFLCYLGDMLSAAGGCELSTTTCVKTAWKNFKELLPVFSSCHLSFKTRGSLYSSCVWSAMLHASETWPLTKPNLPSAAEWRGNDQTDLQCQAARHCHHQVQWATCMAWHWGSGPHSEGEKVPLVWTCGTLQLCSQDSLWHTGWWKTWAWEAQDDMEAAGREWLQRVEALCCRLSC